jgi:hypothetical protein
MLNRLTLEAEAWAESGTRKQNEVPLSRQSLWRGYPRLDPPHATISLPNSEFAANEHQYTQMKE